jgi:cyclic pyranopterin phosphate synthase
MKKISHLDREGRATMVDITKKTLTHREAVARCSVYMKPGTMELIVDKKVPKGDVFSVARIAGIMAAKKTSELIPMCHPLDITAIDIKFNLVRQKRRIDIESHVSIIGRTGVEMEALTAVSVAALAIYDMCKAVDKEMVISELMLVEKRGGESGAFKRK